MSASAPLLTAIVGPGVDPAAAGSLLARLVTGPVTAVALPPGGTPGSRRNRAAVEAPAPFLTFVGAALLDGGLADRSFLGEALRALVADPSLAAVTALGDGVPVRTGRRVERLAPALLAARPLFVEAPLVLRRAAWADAGGFDETLAGGEEGELLLRLAGAVGLLEEPLVVARPLTWAPLSDEAARAAFDTIVGRHRAFFDAALTEAILGRERFARELEAEARALAAREAELGALLARMAPARGPGRP